MKRREFLGGCAGLTATSLTSSVLQLQMTNSAVASIPNLHQPTEYKALVCVFLYGGNDSYNMLLPLGKNGSESEFENYRQARGSLALNRNQISAQGIDGPDGMKFALNNNASEMEDMYRAGDLSFIANVGTLSKPVHDVDAYNRLTSAERPKGLFSHNDQQEIWQTSLTNQSSSVGWMGRIADCINDQVNNNANISMNISVGRRNLMQSGSTVVPFVIGSDPDNPVPELSGYNPNNLYGRSTNHMLERWQNNLFKRQYKVGRQKAIAASREYNQIISQVSVDDSANGAPTFVGTLGDQLKAVVRNIKARDTFGAKRQTFFVFQGGYDTHSNQDVGHAQLLSELSQNLAAFNHVISNDEDGSLHNQVTTYTASDFGRTLSSNGAGSDHAWGGNQVIMGGAVDGGKILGNYPEDLRNPSTASRDLDVGRGRILPTTSVDELHAELARWYGVPNDNNLNSIIPGIRRFNRPGDAMPIGALADPFIT